MNSSWEHRHADNSVHVHPLGHSCDAGKVFVTKDSGARETFDTGMVRDTQEGKPRFDLIIPEGVTYPAQMLTRIANLMARGAEKYGDRNWEKAATKEELARARASVFRHFMQWFCGETDEDHAAAVFFNVQEIELIKGRLEQQAMGDSR